MKIVITIFSTTRSSIFGRERKAEEVDGRVVTMSKGSSSDLPSNAICYHCGKPGHLKFNFNTISLVHLQFALSARHTLVTTTTMPKIVARTALLFSLMARGLSRKSRLAEVASLLLLVADLLLQPVPGPITKLLRPPSLLRTIFMERL